MKISVKEFMDQTKCAKASINNRLSEYFNEIKELRENGYTFKNIVKFLSLNGIETTVSNVQYFYKKHIDKTNRLEVDYENMSFMQKRRLQLAEKRRLEAQQGNHVNEDSTSENIKEAIKAKDDRLAQESEHKPITRTDINNPFFNTKEVKKRTQEQIQQDKERLGKRYDPNHVENGGEYRPKWSKFTNEEIY